MRSTNTLGQRLLALALGTAIGLALAEVAARWARPELAQMGRAHSSVGWATPEYADFDPAAGPFDDALRVLALGDSYLGPGYVNDGLDQRFAAVLERRSSAAIRGATLASPGWGTDQQLLAYLEKGRAWKPDVVVLAFCANNDLIDVLLCRRGTSSHKPYFALEDGELNLYSHEGERLVFEAAERSRWTWRSRLVEWVQYARAKNRAATPAAGVDRVDPRYMHYDALRVPIGEEFYELAERLESSPQLGPSFVNAYTVEQGEWNAYQWRLMQALLARLRDEVHKDGARLVILLMPMTLRHRDARFVTGSGLVHTFETPAGPLTLDMDFPARKLGEICAAEGIELIDPSREFHALLSEPGTIEAMWPVPDAHWSQLVHVFLARHVHQWIERTRASE